MAVLAGAAASTPRRLGLAVLAAGALGVAMAVLKGQDAGVRSALGNASAPWMVVPFAAGSLFCRVRLAALAGVAATLAAFAGFYAAESAVLDVDLGLALASGHVYERLGLASGLLYGTLGGLWASRRVPLAPVAVGLAFVLEPPAVLVLVRAGRWGGDGPLAHTWMWTAEVLLGLAAIAFAITRRARAA